MIALIAASLRGLPWCAPFRSTTCRRRAPRVVHGDAVPERMRPGLPDLIPPHVRNLVPGSARLGHVGEGDDGAVEHRQPGRIALGAALEEHLLADAQAEEWLSTRRLLDRLAQSAF